MFNFRYPSTDFEKINLDWIMKTLGSIKDSIPMIQEASEVYNRCLTLLESAETSITALTQLATDAQESAAGAQQSAASAQESATSAQQSASNAFDNSASALMAAQASADSATNSANYAASATAAASAAESSVSWHFVEQLIAVNNNNDSPTLYSQYVDYTNAKGGLLLEFADFSPADYYGNNTIFVPALAIRGDVSNYWDNPLSLPHYRSFYYGDTYKLIVKIEQKIEVLDSVNHYYARVIIMPASSYYASTPVYINIYAR